MKPSNPLLQKQALDETFVMWNDPDYAEHQHHSDPNFTTQNGKDYAGRNTTEVEDGALQDGIPASLLSVELGKTGDVDNPNVTTIPSAPADVDPDNATFFKESDKMSPAEEKIMEIVGPEGFHYGAHVNDGTTLFFRGSGERLSYDPKTGNVTYSKDGKAVMESSIHDLKKHVNQMLKSAAREFHETLKAMLGQTAAIRPSPHKVFEQKIDESTGQEMPKPAEPTPNDADIEQAKETLENADAIGKQIASKTASKWGDKLKKMQARRDPANIEEYGTKASGFGEGGPFSCSDCVHKVLSKNAAGEGVAACVHPTVMADPELVDRKLPDGTIEVDADDCCRFVRKPEKNEKTSSCHHKKTTCRKCSNVQTCRCSAPKVSSFVDSCSNCDGTFDKDGAVTKSYGTGTPFGGTPNDPSEDVQDEEDEKTAGTKTALVGLHETPKHLPPRDDIRRHIDEDVQKEIKDDVMEGVADTTAKVAFADDDESNEYYLDQVSDMKAEAKATFMQDPFMLQDAADQGMTMDDLWNEVGQDFTQNYWESADSKRASIAPEEGLPCPNCKSTKGKPVEDGESGGVSLRECLTCGSFF